MMHKDATKIVPMFSPLLINEPVPQQGKIRLSDAPGFGVDLDRTVLSLTGEVSDSAVK